MKTFKEFLTEERVDVNNFKTYSDATQYALKDVELRKLTYNEDEYAAIVSIGSKRPSIGKTTSWILPLYKADGVTSAKKSLIVNVYGKENGKYELNHYIQ